MSRSAESYLRLVRIPIVVVLLGVLVSGCGVNNIPTYEESAKAKWSDVLNQYQRRADLIPNLVETVKGYAAHERQVLEEVTAARARATQTQLTIPADVVTNPEAFKRFQEAQASLSGALSRLLAVSETLSRPEGEPELSRIAIAARRHREPHRGGAPRLHRGGAHLQHRAAHVSGRDLGVDALPQRQADGDLHDRRRGQETARP